METETRTFPPHPIRDLRVTYARQTGCPSDFAGVTVDFEPWENGFVFEAAADAGAECGDPREAALFQAAFAEGVARELATLGPETVVAVAVVLRRIRVHEVDSGERSFAAAGRLAVREALVRAYGPPSCPKRGTGRHR